MAVTFILDENGETLKVREGTSGGQGLAFDQLGTELREVPILFTEGSGELLAYVPVVQIVSFGGNWVWQDFDVTVKSGGSFQPGTQAWAWTQYDVVATSGGSFQMGWFDLAWTQYDVVPTVQSILFKEAGTKDAILTEAGNVLILESSL